MAVVDLLQVAAMVAGPAQQGQLECRAPDT